VTESSQGSRYRWQVKRAAAQALDSHIRFVQRQKHLRRRRWNR